MGKVMAGILEEGRWGVMGERRWEDMAMIGVKVLGRTDHTGLNGLSRGDSPD